MIYLRTGANGTCKTLFTLADVRKLQLETGRPVCINSRFKMNEAKRLEFGWTIADFKDWQSQQDGTIFLIDECHNDMPVRPAGSAVPDAVRMLAEHRSRGFDFFLLTQHPMNIDSFVRKLIGAPGWHQHLKRVFGGTRSTRVLQWDAVNPACEKDGSGKNAQITTRLQPREVYSWYDSASLHTAKTRVPLKVWFLALALFLIPALIWAAYSVMAARTGASSLPPAAKSLPASYVSAPASPPSGFSAPVSAQDYVASYVPRLVGLPHTASRYDEVTKPTVAPYPAACIRMGARCNCYTQQGTLLPVDGGVCAQIVTNGFFHDWGDKPSGESVARPAVVPASPWPGNPGASPAVSVASPSPSPDTGSQGAEVFARVGRVGGGSRLALTN